MGSSFYGMELGLMEDGPKKTNLCCPKCGSTYGYYILSRVSGFAKSSYNWDGSAADSHDMHDGVTYKDLKTKRCWQCHSVVKEPADEKET